jgi:L-rhamnose-H+ transport protein
MAPNPPVGVMYHWIGGLAAASFYLPFKAIRKWSWQTYWLVGGVASWILAPIFFAFLLVPGFWHVLRDAPHSALTWAFVFGAIWGVGGLTFGLTVRYLGLALGYAMALGLCTVFGTLVPPIADHSMAAFARQHSGQITLAGVAVAVLGIVFSGLAGTSKEHELPIEQKQSSVSEFQFGKGMIIAIICGLLSAAMAFGLAAAKPIGDASAKLLLSIGRSDIWSGLPSLVVILLGGFVTNLVWCVILIARSRSAGEYTGRTAMAERIGSGQLINNYWLAGLAGLIWYFQFFFYTMGSTKMGAYGFASWTLHMASIIIFSTLWGIALKEWRGTSRRTHVLIALGLGTLILSTVVIGYGSDVAGKEKISAVTSGK